MGFKIKNSLTGEFEKLPILTLKGEKGETGGVEEYNKVDYMGNKYETLKQANDANVEYAVKTAIGEFNYLDYDGQHITATDTIEGRSKSAILSGNTERIPVGKNIFDKTSKLYDGWLYANGDYCEEIGGKFYTTDFIEVKPNTDIVVNNGGGYAQYDDNKKCICNVAYGSTTTLSNTKYIRVVVKKEVIDTLQIEYGTVSTNYEEPIFELQSVKMPVLTTTGKNLFKGFTKYDYSVDNGVTIKEITDNSLTYIAYSWNTSIVFYIPIDGDKNYIMSADMTNVVADDFYFVDELKQIIGTKFSLNKCVTSPTNAKFIKWHVRNALTHADCLISNFQLEENSVTTTYEPYKSNILTANEDVTLRSNGSVCDELDLLTGKLTQRIDEDGEVLTQEVVKTVDLSDNHVYSYKGTTHYDCSSAEGSLVPTLSVKVPTDVQATIAQQRETIQTLNSENERLNQIQEALKASMLDSQVQLMNLSWDTDFEVFTLRESIAPKDFSMDSKTGSNIDKFSQAKFIIENDCPDLEKLNSQIEYYFSKDVFSQEQFEELTDLISIVKGENGCEY